MNKLTLEEKKKRVDEILSRGVIKQVLPSVEEFKEALLGDKQLKFYIGADTTGRSLHLSHAKNFMLLEEFRQLGHKVYVLFGDLTACIGDPSDKLSARSRLTREMAKENAMSWVEQIRPIINFDDPENPAEVVFNSTWFDKFTVTELLELFSNATVQQLIERDMFQKRLAENRPIFLHEFLYPMFQGYDSVALDVDVELCGTDQIFNALSGRELLKKYSNKNKFVVAVNLMENPKTGQLMSKTNNTGVFLGGTAKDMFGQIMAQPDEMIEIILINDTRVPLEKIKQLDIENNPMQAKLFTAKEVVRIFYGEQAAQEEYDNFIATFSKKGFPEDAPEVKFEENEVTLLDLVFTSLEDQSKSAVRRLIQQGSVSINDEKITNEFEKISLPKDSYLEVKVGKKNFYKVSQK